MKHKSQAKIIDEFAFILLGALILIGILLVFWTTPPELPPSLTPRSISVKMLPNTQKTITFKIIGNLTSINMVANETISSFVSFPENNFDVYGEKEVKAILSSPSSYGKYSGYIIAKGKGGEDSIHVTLHVVPTLTLTSRSISIQDFTVSNYGNKKVDSKSDFVVERSLFSSKEARLFFDREKREIEEVKLKIRIVDASGSGYLVVKLNGNTVFRKKAAPGFEEIVFNVSEIKEFNVISIGVENEGLGIFFKTFYYIQEARVEIKYKSFPHSFELLLSPQEIDNFYALEFSSVLVQQDSPVVEMRVNNQKVFIGRFPSSVVKINISKDLLGNEILLYPSNNISFSLLSEGEIHFSNNIIKIYSYSG